MSYNLDRLRDHDLPSDITLRTPIYRQRGIIASLVATLVATWSARRQLNRITRHYRRRPPEDIPDYLRQDIGLPPAPPRPPSIWELRP